MERSAHAFFREIVDYAGLFPPAQLALDAAIQNYARYPQQPDAWLLGRFICPAPKLDQLAPFRDELFADEHDRPRRGADPPSSTLFALQCHKSGAVRH